MPLKDFIPSSPRSRVLILMPVRKDATATVDIFSKNGIISCICNTLAEVCEEIKKGAGTAVLTEEMILLDKEGILQKTLENEPRWSDFPLLVLTPAGSHTSKSIKALEAIGHMTLMQRPVQIIELLSAVRSSLRDRQRQYKVRDYLIERDKQEEALRTSEEKFRQLLDTLPAGAYTCDPDGLITYFNQQAVQMWGRAPKLNDTLDRFCGSFKLFAINGTPLTHDACWMALALKTGKGYIGEEIVVERPNGERLTVLAHANPILDGQGELAGAINILVDISDRKKAEDALKEADKRKDDFLAILAHELRNPLAPISNAMPILQSPEASKETRFKAMDIVVRQVNQMVRLVDDLMDVSRIRGGKIELHKERISLRDVIQNAIETSRPLIEEQKHELTVELPAALVYVNADLLRLSQVISNLLNNAAKYTEPRGHIWLTLEQAGNVGIIRVRDNGIGIPSNMLPRIFDMFTQVDDSLERAQGGIGIGLMLVKNLIEMHGGSVEVNSEGGGKGSQFTLRLPVAADVREEVKEEADANENKSISQTPSLRILLVEDYEVLAQMTTWALEIEGHEVRVAHDGPQAFKMVKDYIPDVVLMDIGLPGMSGYEICELMRKEPALRDTIFIAQTGWGQEEHRQRSKAAGFHHHMVKPIDTQALQGLLYPRKESFEAMPDVARALSA